MPSKRRSAPVKRRPASSATPAARGRKARNAPAAQQTVPAPSAPPIPARPSGGPGFPIVGIGASAGGLEALEELFAPMPEDTGMAFVVVTHQHPGHPSLLPELLGRITRMKVVEAADRLPVEPNHVYVSTPGGYLAILHGRLHRIDTEQHASPQSLRTTIEELETANEGLKSSNEEMQSLNEELTTVNTEMQSKVEDLSRTNDDMQNLLNSTEVATLFLDTDLNFKHYTEPAKRLGKAEAQFQNCLRDGNVRTAACEWVTKAGRETKGTMTLKLLTNENGRPDAVCLWAKHPSP